MKQPSRLSRLRSTLAGACGVLLTVFLLLAAAAARAAAWGGTAMYGGGTVIYASPTGVATNSGLDALHPKTLEAALAVAGEDYTIILAPGDYPLWDYAGLTISNGVTLVGSEEPSQTVIRAKPAAEGYTGSRFGLTLINATIAGLTLSDCYATSSTAGQILNASGTSLVTNCIIGHATVNRGDTGTVINLSDASRITHTIIRNIIKGFQNGWTGKSDFITLNNAAEITDSVVSNNTIHVVQGATVKLNGASSALRRTLVTGNRQRPAEYVHCAAGVYAGAGVVEDCVISGNVLEAGSGPSTSANGLYATGSAVVRRCNISGNTGGANSAGGVFANSSVILENIIVSGNETSHGSGSGGIHIEGGAVLIHATLYGNKATARTTGHGLRLAHKNCKAYNTISYGNGLDDARFTTGNLEKSAGMITHSLVTSADEAALGSAGMLYGDPLFTGAEAGDFTLRLTSPCVDAGADLTTTTYKFYGTNDYNQIMRPQLTAPDMGAYELVPSGEMEADLSVSEDPTTTGRSVTFTAVGLPSGDIASYSWKFTAPDGTQTTVTTTTNIVSHTFAVCGIATSEVTVAWSGGGSATASVISHITGRVAYANPDGANVWPYDTAAKAATNVQAAIDAVYAETAMPGRVYLAPGTYNTAHGQPASESYMFSLARPIELIGCGANPADTVLDGMDARRVLSLGHAQAVVTNILVANAKNHCTDATIGFAVHNGGGTVTGCIVTNGVSFDIYSAECMVYMSSGIIENTDLCGHRQTARVHNDAGVPVYITGGTMRHCRVFNNRFCDRSRSGAVTLIGATALMENCEITGNRGVNPEYSHFAAGGVSIRDGATMRRCLVASNERDGGASYRNAGGVNANGGAPIIDSCIITNNSAGDTGTWGFATGGIFIGSAATLRNCLIAGNTSSQRYADRAAGGVRIDNAGARLINCTIVGNASPDVPTNSAVRMTAGSITNCIVWGNGTFKSGAWITAPILVHGGTVGYTCNEELIGGVGNTTQPPVFNNPAAGDYSLKRFRPELCRVAPRIEGITTDILGRPRQGRKLDLGAYAFTGNFGLVIMLR